MPEQSSAVIMAGGEGRRMARTRPDVPKPLVRLGGIPLIEITIRQLVAAGIRDIHVALHHRADEIVEHLKHSRCTDGIAIHYIIEPRPLGTIGTLVELRKLGRTVLTANGDLLSGVDLMALFAFHRREGADMTIPTHTERTRLKLGEVFSDAGNRVTRYVEKPVKEYRISSGIYIIEPRLISLVNEGEALPFPDLVGRALEAGMTVLEHHHREPWIDINDEDDLVTGYAMLADNPAAFGLDPGEIAGFENPPAGPRA